MSVSQLKITFGDADRCVPDCGGAARLKSGLPVSPERPRPAPRGLSSPGTTRGARAPTDVRGSQREMRRSCHSLSRGDDIREGPHTSKCHQVQFTSPASGPERQQRPMKNGSHYEPDPS